ncbi:hypothetical protein ACFVZD_47510 [Streptomyces sp. NPDC058287]|uniref:hypothetical protein n=1 Tax=Streptomyces sp. NPDC058287 TaxID=3346423 RepID=UPI0036E90000
MSTTAPLHVGRTYTHARRHPCIAASATVVKQHHKLHHKQHHKQLQPPAPDRPASAQTQRLDPARRHRPLT